MSLFTRSSGQTSLEFLSMLILLMLAFSGFYSIFVDKQIEARDHQRTLYATSIAEKAAFEADLALVQGHGYSRNFTLPAAVGGFPYNVTVGDETIRVEWKDRRVYASTAVPSIQGSFVPGQNTVTNNRSEIYVVQK